MSDDIEDIRRKILRWASLVSSVQQEKDLREAAAAIDKIERLTAERDHWKGLVSRADLVQFPFEDKP